ncbi:hypothetical protein QBC46DRAFT_458267 [Diplogelasinospora grovesii]|uniref:6-phosphogluconate dehydrogenase C-terminal domain-like protein n=1 Tax=Diplogelasinospora grovesii TaxID=303347 RepID=A0AAN6ND60_9PEZI|nr:hypothetical protein QBC46DRAFT_458267 [Diplogelasinospora grovesii]
MILSRLLPRRSGCFTPLFHTRLLLRSQYRRSLSTCFSVSLDPSTASKENVLSALSDVLARTGQLQQKAAEKQPANAAVILASKSLSSWLDDESFISKLLAPLCTEQSSTASSEKPEVLVLSAAVDGIPRSSSATASEGLSVLYGQVENIFHGQQSTEPGRTDFRGAAPTHPPSLEFHTPPLRGGSREKSRKIYVTVPLANTVFETGMPYTITISSYAVSGAGGPLRVSRGVPGDVSQKIVLPSSTSSSSSDVSVPLLPITNPQKIATGLGNILRQLEGPDGKLTPASKELEDIIPKLLDTRAKKLPPADSQADIVSESGPMGVWALVIPERVAQQFMNELPGALQLGSEGEGEEWERAKKVAKLMPKLLASGCHLRKILSGGGGWGLKQGLLSLDPQTRYSNPDQEDVESFIRSFKGEDDSPGSIVTPGSYVQFLVEPIPSKQVQQEETSGSEKSENTLVIGTQNAAAAEPAKADGTQVILDQFGAVSAQGIYISSTNTMATTTTQPRAKIGILSMGDMGSGIARLLIAHGYAVATNLAGRSQDTIDRATSAGVIALPDDVALCKECDVILSVVPPKDAAATAERLRSAITTTPSFRKVEPLYVCDMNAISPASCRTIFTSHFPLPSITRGPPWVRFVDGCILGGPPSTADDDGNEWSCPLMPTSGPYNLAEIPNYGEHLTRTLRMRHISEDIGAASGLKMCFASLSKGYAAIAVQAVTTAQKLGVLSDLKQSLRELAPANLERMEKAVVGMAPKAYRWVAEMEEISATHMVDGGFGPELFKGAADVFRVVTEDTVLGQEKIGKRKRGTNADDVAAAMVEGMQEKRKKRD